jgi:hypothetical protein
MTAPIFVACPLLPDHYTVSDTGEVRNERTGKILKPQPPTGRRKHLKVKVGRLSHGGGDFYPHDLVAAAFIGPKPPGALVRHLDDNVYNNTPRNLCYGSRSENEQDKHTWKAHPCGDFTLPEDLKPGPDDPF